MGGYLFNVRCPSASVALGQNPSACLRLLPGPYPESSVPVGLTHGELDGPNAGESE